MESTQCPVCGISLEGPISSTTQHVNMCIDTNESLTYIQSMVNQDLTNAALQGQRKFGYCPICYKLTGVNAKHIKRCGQLKGIGTKELIKMVGPSKGSKTPKAAKIGRSKKTPKGMREVKCSEIKDNLGEKKTKDQEKPEAFGFKPVKPRKGRKKSEPKKQTKAALKAVKNNAILAATPDGLTLRVIRPMGVSNGELTKLSKEEKQNLIRQRLDLVLSENVCPDNYVHSSVPLLPYIWRISALDTADVNYIVNGFERFCLRSGSQTIDREKVPNLEVPASSSVSPPEASPTNCLPEGPTLVRSDQISPIASQSEACSSTNQLDEQQKMDVSEQPSTSYHSESRPLAYFSQPVRA